MDETIRDIVWRGASDRCVFCRIPQEATPFFTFHVEHIVAKQHIGPSDHPGGLCLACNRCNAFKGPNLTSIDPDTQEIVLLFNPRKDSWNDHFLLRRGEVVGITPTGRATVHLLNMNAPNRVELREEWHKGAAFRHDDLPRSS
jgi:hypothetical protein